MKDFTLVRKPTRSKNIDYSKPGAYFVTICTHGRKHLLSKIENVSKQCCNEVWHINREAGSASYSPTSAGGFIVNFPELRLTEIGKTVEDKLIAVSERFSNIRIDEYVIMPNHIHAIVFMDEYCGKSARDLNDVVRVFKSLASRECKVKYQIDRLFQRSYHDHLIKDKDDYLKIARYIRDNPKTWFYNRYYNK